MDVETATIDQIEESLLRSESVIARERASQTVLLREVDRRQAPMAAGCGSLGEWVILKNSPTSKKQSKPV